MNNAHLRMGQLEYRQATRNVTTHIRVRADRYMGEKDHCNLISVFGGDTEIGAISAAIAEGCNFTLTFPNGSSRMVTLGEHATCYRGALVLEGRKTPLRHLVAISQSIQQNGSSGKTYMLNYLPALAWNTLVSYMGLPATPEWGSWMLSKLEENRRIKELDGIGCEPVVITATREEILNWISCGVESQSLAFPATNGPIPWPTHSIQTALIGDEPTADSGLSTREAA